MNKINKTDNIAFNDYYLRVNKSKDLRVRRKSISTILLTGPLLAANVINSFRGLFALDVICHTMLPY